MNSGPWIWVGIGGSIGSLLRYALALWAGNQFKGLFPWGTFVANGVGAFLLGILQGSSVGEVWLLFLGTGLLGGLTTFSTWMLESLRLIEEGEYSSALVNLIGSMLMGLIVFWLGYSVSGGQL